MDDQEKAERDKCETGEPVMDPVAREVEASSVQLAADYRTRPAAHLDGDVLALAFAGQLLRSRTMCVITSGRAGSVTV